MKKIICIVVLVFAFSYTAKAQDASKNLQNLKEKAINEMAEINKVIKLDSKLNDDLTTLLVMRDEILGNTRTEEEKKALFERFGAKFLGGLTEEQREALKKNKNIYERLMVYPVNQK